MFVLCTEEEEPKATNWIVREWNSRVDVRRRLRADGAEIKATEGSAAEVEALVDRRIVTEDVAKVGREFERRTTAEEILTHGEELRVSRTEDGEGIDVVETHKLVHRELYRRASRWPELTIDICALDEEAR